MQTDDAQLPALMDHARNTVDEAKTSAELLAARDVVRAALHYAKLKNASYRSRGDCLLLLKRTEIRLADEIDAGQASGEIAIKEGRPTSTQILSTSAPATLAELGINSGRVTEWRKVGKAGFEHVTDIVNQLIDEDCEPTDAAILRIIAGKPHLTRFTGEQEWYTPAEYLDAARACMGGIDLDPASSIMAQETVKAERFFTYDDDGLAHDWHGRVWLNPPYAQPAIAHFIGKLIGELDAGRATEAILLTHNSTDTAWWHAAAGQCKAICFTRGRIAFINATGDFAAPVTGQTFFYFGPNEEIFSETFADFGIIL